jgi:hypothetical protein
MGRLFHDVMSVEPVPVHGNSSDRVFAPEGSIQVGWQAQEEGSFYTMSWNAEVDPIEAKRCAQHNCRAFHTKDSEFCVTHRGRDQS